MSLLVGLVVTLLGLALGAGGAWLLALGGSWYYVIAGLGLMLSGVLLMRRHRAGAWVYWLVLAGTAIWTAWESGLDYWRWVPRLGLILALGVLVALIAPWLRNGPSVRRAWSLATVFVILFIAAFALAFVPHGRTRGGALRAAVDEASAVRNPGAAVAVQPADHRREPEPALAGVAGGHARRGAARTRQHGGQTPNVNCLPDLTVAQREQASDVQHECPSALAPGSE